MLLILYALLAVVPLFGIAWILLQGSVTTVDGLFMSLIFLAISGIFGMSALFELRTMFSGKSKAGSRSASSGPARGGTGNGSVGNVQQGRVESVQFFESSVGQPNKSIVTLSSGPGSSRWLVFEGDLRNALPVGKKVEITSREAGDHKILLNVEYS